MIDALPIPDVACLVAGVSDNLATNVLLDRIGLPAVQALAAALGLRDSALLDRVRMRRAPDDPPHLSVGSAGEWSSVMTAIATDRLVSPAVSGTLRRWLAGNADLSMVAMPYGLDPLAHREPDRGWSVFNKTGSDPGTRADVGVVRLDAVAVGYAAIARWPVAQPDLHAAVLDGMHAFGRALRQYLIAGTGSSMST